MRQSPKWEVSDIVQRFGATIRSSGYINAWQKKVLTALENCRTAVLGGHVDACDSCGLVRVSYNSCRDSNCPKCQSLERESWVLSRQEELLPVAYYHVVFTLPVQLNGLCVYNSRFMYDALFESAWATLQKFATDPKWLGAKGGATMVLHTWGQNLMLHPHVHAIVPGGGLGQEGDWVKNKRGGEKFLYPVKALSRVFRAIFMKKVCAALQAGLLVLPIEEELQESSNYRAWRNDLYHKPWVVYAKRPFGGPKQVIEYLGRYTHKTAISNHRIQEVTDTEVRFSYKDYRVQGQRKEMTLSGEEFLRRFCLHIRPKGFRRMRHYGILSNANKGKALSACRASLCPQEQVPKPKKDKKQIRQAALQQVWKGQDPQQCPCCKTGKMVRIGWVPPQPRAPPGAMPQWIPLND